MRIIQGPSRQQQRRDQHHEKADEHSDEPIVAELQERAARWHQNQVESKEECNLPPDRNFPKPKYRHQPPKHRPPDVLIERHSAKESAFYVEVPPSESQVEQLQGE